MDFLRLSGPPCAQTQPKPLPKRIMFSWSETLLTAGKHPGTLGHPPKGAKPEALGCLGVHQEQLQSDLKSRQAFLRRKMPCWWQGRRAREQGNTKGRADAAELWSHLL